ncbi:hypothetical protein C2U65_16565, partial [Acinetobacter baumannii]
SDPRDHIQNLLDSPKPQALYIKGLGLCRFWQLCFFTVFHGFFWYMFPPVFHPVGNLRRIKEILFK